MSRVKSLPSRHALEMYDAHSDLISLKVSDKSPTRYDFDIIQSLDNEVNLNEQFSDIKYLHKYDSHESCIVLSDHHTPSGLSSWNTDNETSVVELLQETDNQEDYFQKFILKLESDNIGHKDMAPNNKENTVVNCVSLNSFTEHHQELDPKPQILKNFRSQISLADLITDNSSKGLSSLENPNAFELSFSEGGYNLPKLPSDSEKKNYDLSVLPEFRGTNIIQSSDVSLADLANSHLSNSPKSNDNYLEELLIVDDVNSGHKIVNFDLTNKFTSDLSSVNSGVNILEELSLADLLKTENSVSNFEKCSKDVKIPLIETSNKMSEIDYNLCSLSDALHIGKTANNLWESQKNSEKNLSDTSSSEDEIVPEIDLNFCIRNPCSFSTENYDLTSSSLKSSDSGFDETDFMTLKNRPVTQDSVSCESIYSPIKEVQSSLLNPKGSLLSRAISCKPKSNKTKSEKLRKIKKNLIMKHFPQSFLDCKQQCLEIYEKVEDHSNQCVMMNSQFDGVDQ